MYFNVTENPKRRRRGHGLPGSLIRKHGGNMRAAWREYKSGKSNPRKGKKHVTHRRRRVTRAVSHTPKRSTYRPRLHRVGSSNRYSRTARSKSLFPSVIISNPRMGLRRRHHRAYRNPSLGSISGVKNTVIDSAKTLVAFLGTLGIANVTVNMVNDAMKLSPMQTTLAKNAVRIGIAFGGSKVTSRFLGAKAASDLKVIVTTYALYDVLMTYLKGTTLATYAAPFSLSGILPSTLVPQHSQISGMGRLLPSMGRITPDLGATDQLVDQANGS